MPRRVNQAARAAEAWGILTAQAVKGEPITYGQLAKIMGVHPRVCRFFLGLIQEYCMSASLPPLQSLVVNKTTGIPGEGYYATPREANRVNETHIKVFDFEWRKQNNPFCKIQRTEL